LFSGMAKPLESLCQSSKCPNRYRPHGGSRPPPCIILTAPFPCC
jgi:hypothetical protein